MSRARWYLICLLLVFILVGIQLVSAQDEPKITTQINRETVEWSLAPDVCTKLKVELPGTGEKTQSITTTEMDNGSKHVVDDVVISGTASDSTGEYRYVYGNRAVRDIPAGDGPIKILMIDTFYLKGSGEVELNENFIWSWTYTPPAEEWPPTDNWQKIHSIGDPLNCDPL
jgi:hypothetical protein